MDIGNFLFRQAVGHAEFYRHVHKMDAEDLCEAINLFVDNCYVNVAIMDYQAIEVAKKKGLLMRSTLSMSPDGGKQVWDVSVPQPYISYNGKVGVARQVIATGPTVAIALCRALLMDHFFGPYKADEVRVPDTVKKVTIVGGTTCADTHLFNAETQQKIDNCTGVDVKILPAEFNMAEIKLLVDVDYVTLEGR